MTLTETKASKQFSRGKDTTISLCSGEVVDVWLNKDIFTSDGNLQTQQEFKHIENTHLLSLEWPSEIVLTTVTQWTPQVTIRSSERKREFAQNSAAELGSEKWEMVKRVMERCHKQFDAYLLEVSFWGVKLGHKDVRSAQCAKDNMESVTHILRYLLADTEYLFRDIMVRWSFSFIHDAAGPVQESSAGLSQSLLHLNGLATDGPGSPLSCFSRGNSGGHWQQVDMATIDEKQILVHVLEEVQKVKQSVLDLKEQVKENHREMCERLEEGMNFTSKSHLLPLTHTDSDDSAGPLMVEPATQETHPRPQTDRPVHGRASENRRTSEQNSASDSDSGSDGRLRHSENSRDQSRRFPPKDSRQCGNIPHTPASVGLVDGDDNYINRDERKPRIKENNSSRKANNHGSEYGGQNGTSSSSAANPIIQGQSKQPSTQTAFSASSNTMWNRPSHNQTSRNMPSAAKHQTSAPSHQPSNHQTSHPSGHQASNHQTSHPSGHQASNHQTSHPSGHQASNHQTSHPSGHQASNHQTSHPSGHQASNHQTSHPSGHQASNHQTSHPSGHQGSNHQTSHPSGHQASNLQTSHPSGHQGSNLQTSHPSGHQTSNLQTSHPSGHQASNHQTSHSQPSGQRTSSPPRQFPSLSSAMLGSVTTTGISNFPTNDGRRDASRQHLSSLINASSVSSSSTGPGRPNEGHQESFTQETAVLPDSFSTKSVAQEDLVIMVESASEAQLVKESVRRAYKEDDVKPPKAQSFDTVLCLDISESMKQGGAFERMKETALAFIDGVEDIVTNFGTEENMGLVTFGGRANVVQNLTNDFGLIRDQMDQLEPGGRSPFVEAFLVSMAAFVKKGGIVSVSGEWRVKPRIIFISDGLPTESTEGSGLDIASNINNNYMKAMSSLCDGVYVEPENIHDLCDHFRIQETIGKVLVCLKRETEGLDQEKIDATMMALTPDLTDAEKEKVLEVIKRELANPSRKRSRHPRPTEFDNVFENTDKVNEGERLPLGTRVIRGPDWTYDDQDGGGPGTVINHHEGRSLHWVNWDNTDYNCYPFSHRHGFHIWRTDDHPRLRKDNGPLEIGMTVKKGKDWKPVEGQQEQGEGQGIIIRKSSSYGRLMVRWSNGVIQVCQWLPDGLQEVEYCPPHKDTDNVQHHRLGPADQQSTPGDAVPVSFEGQGSWQWRDGNKTWHSYDKAINEEIEATCKRKNVRSCIIRRDGKTCRIMFKKMVEKVIDNGMEFEVRRIQVVPSSS